MPAAAAVLAAALAASPASAPAQAQARAEAIAEIRALVAAATRADLAGDAAFYDRLLAPDFTLGTSQGELLGRDEKLAGFRSGEHRVEDEVVEDVRVRLYGATTAVATLRATIAWRYGAEHGRRTVLFTQTYVRAAAGWRLVASHGSEVRRPAAEKAPESAP